MQLVSTSIILVLLAIIGVSVAYYALSHREKQQESQQRIQIGFDIILNDLAKQTQTYTTRILDFLQHESAPYTAVSLYNSDPRQLRDARFVSSYIANAADKLKGFAYVIAAQELRLYGNDQRLLVVYQRKADLDIVGGYVISATGQDAYFPLDDPSLVAKALVFEKKPIPDAVLPQDLAPTYPEMIPETITAGFFRKGTQLGFRIVAPLTGSGKVAGVLVGEIALTQAMIEEYATLSKTAVNVFAGDQFSIGTLPVQSQISIAPSPAFITCQDLVRPEQNLKTMILKFEQQEYIQGQCALTHGQEVMGAVTVSLSRKAEQQALTRMLMVVIAIGLVTLAAAIGVAFFFSQRVSRSVESLARVVGAVTQGDLRAMSVVMRQDELGVLAQNMNQMIEQLRAIVHQVQRSGIQVTSSATELSVTAKQQEATMAAQADSTKSVVTTIQEITEVTANLVQTMQQVAAMLQETVGFASSGQTDLARMEEAMRHMEDASKAISEKLAAINEKAENITTVVTTITKVSEQTNLLSLNAAIEAEKAGEYGRGFTVVAREIRRLADQTAVATLDIERMVHDMQSAVTAGVMEMDKFIASVRGNAEDVEKISTQLSHIIEQVQALWPNFDQMNTAITFQSDKTQQIDEAMLFLSEQMQQSKDTFHETYAAIEQLNDAAHGLQEEVLRFKVE